MERKDENYYRINNLLFKSTVTENTDEATTTIQFESAIINNLQLVKTYTFHKESNLNDLSVKLINHSESRIKISDESDYGLSISWGAGFRNYGTELNRTETVHINSVFATAEEVSYENPKVGDTKETTGQIFWAGAQDRFFTALIIPKQDMETIAVKTTHRKKNRIPEQYAEFNSSPITTSLYTGSFNLESVAKGDTQNSQIFQYKIFTGPKDPGILKDISKPLAAFVGSNEDRLDMTGLLFYDTWWAWLRSIKLLLLWSLEKIHSFVGSWGLAIVILTIIVRLLMHPLVSKSMREMAKNAEMMKKYKPELDIINEKYKDDPMKKQQKNMELMKEHGFNPLAAPLRGCLPILLQLPIFIALYHILGQSYDLRGAHFMWINDLSQPDALVSWSTLTGGLLTKIKFLFINFGDHLNILPIFYGVSQLALTKFNSSAQASMDPNQKMMMYMFPVIIPIMLYTLPSGLFIYWIVSNFWQFVHQIYAKKFVHDHPEEAGLTETTPATAKAK